MKSITVHNINDRLSALIEKKARENGSSLNKTIKLLLHQALGLDPNQMNQNNREEFEDLFGVWDEKTFQNFQENTNDFNEIDPQDWQ